MSANGDATRGNGIPGFASDLLGRMPGAPALTEEDDPQGPGLPASKHAETAIEITTDEGDEWMVEYAHRLPGRTGKVGVPQFEFRFTDGDKIFHVVIKGDPAQYGEFKRLMQAFVWCRLRNLRPKGPIRSIRVVRG